jgi:hypothetical protein
MRNSKKKIFLTILGPYPKRPFCRYFELNSSIFDLFPKFFLLIIFLWITWHCGKFSNRSDLKWTCMEFWEPFGRRFILTFIFKWKFNNFSFNLNFPVILHCKKNTEFKNNNFYVFTMQKYGFKEFKFLFDNFIYLFRTINFKIN